jgi:hypothetical protein
MKLAGYAALFGVPDADRDTILPGAFAATLARLGAGRTGRLPLYWQHRPSRRPVPEGSLRQRGLRASRRAASADRVGGARRAAHGAVSGRLLPASRGCHRCLGRARARDCRLGRNPVAVSPAARRRAAVRPGDRRSGTVQRCPWLAADRRSRLAHGRGYAGQPGTWRHRRNRLRAANRWDFFLVSRGTSRAGQGYRGGGKLYPDRLMRQPSHFARHYCNSSRILFACHPIGEKLDTPPIGGINSQ